MTMASRIIDVDPLHDSLYPSAAGRQNSQQAPALARALQIIGVLQTTLDIHRLLELFSVEVVKTIAHDGLAYRHDGENIDFTIGIKATHTLSYRLIVAGKPVGRVRLFRETLFQEAETQELEYLLCSLVYPLQNSLLYSQAVQASHLDPLTGINNRSGMQVVLEREVRLCGRHQQPLALMMLDIDYFKSINDRFGHQFGDEVLKLVTQAIVSCVRTSDLVARYGGEEFVVALPNTDIEGALMLAERIRLAVSEQTYTYTSGLMSSKVSLNDVTISIGVTAYEAEDDVVELIGRADQALYQAKVQGRNRVILGESKTCQKAG